MLSRTGCTCNPDWTPELELSLSPSLLEKCSYAVWHGSPVAGSSKPIDATGLPLREVSLREVVIDLKPGSLKEGFYKHPMPHGPITVEFSNGKKKVILPEGVKETMQSV